MSEYADLILLSNCIFTATEEIPFSGYIAMGTKPLRLDSPMYIAFSQVIL